MSCCNCSVFPCVCTRPIYFIKTFSNWPSSQSQILWGVCVLQGLSASCWWNLCLSEQNLVPGTGVRPGGASCWRHWGLSVTHWSNWGLYPAAMGQEQCGSQSQRLADAGLCVIEGLCAGIQGQVAGRASVSTFPKPSRGGHLCLPTKYKMEFKSGYSENTGQQSVLSRLLYVYLWCRPFLPSTAPSSFLSKAWYWIRGIWCPEECNSSCSAAATQPAKNMP